MKELEVMWRLKEIKEETPNVKNPFQADDDVESRTAEKAGKIIKPKDGDDEHLFSLSRSLSF